MPAFQDIVGTFDSSHLKRFYNFMRPHHLRQVNCESPMAEVINRIPLRVSTRKRYVELGHPFVFYHVVTSNCLLVAHRSSG